MGPCRSPVVRDRYHYRIKLIGALDGGAEISLRTKADALHPVAWRTVELTSRQYAPRTARSRLKRHPPRDARRAKLAMASTAIEIKQNRIFGAAMQWGAPESRACVGTNPAQGRPGRRVAAADD